MRRRLLASRNRTTGEIRKLREELLAAGAPQHIVDYFHPLPDSPQDSLVHILMHDREGDVLKVVHLYSSVLPQVIGSYVKVDETYSFVTKEGVNLPVDWGAVQEWVREYRSRDVDDMDVIRTLDLEWIEPSDLPVKLLKRMQADGYDVRTFTKNGDELINASYIALREAELELIVYEEHASIHEKWNTGAYDGKTAYDVAADVEGCQWQDYNVNVVQHCQTQKHLMTLS